MLFLAQISFLSLKAEARPTDTCFLPICSLKYAMRTFAKWFNAVARIAHRCKVIQLQCNTLHRLCLLQTCNQLICSFHHLLRASMPQHATLHLALCNAYCWKSHLVLHALPFGDLYLLFLKTKKIRLPHVRCTLYAGHLSCSSRLALHEPFISLILSTPWAFYTWLHSRSHWPSWWAGLSSLDNTLCCFEHKWGERSPGALRALTSGGVFGQLAFWCHAFPTHPVLPVVAMTFRLTP